jgi:hypothetical protein
MRGRLSICGRLLIGLFRLLRCYFVGQPILAAAGFQRALFAAHYVGFCRKRHPARDRLPTCRVRPASLSGTLRSFAAIAAGRRNRGIDFFGSQTIESLFPRVPPDALEPFRNRLRPNGMGADLFLF